MGKLLLTVEQAAALANVESREIIEASREGKIPRWSLPRTRGFFFDAKDIASVFDVSIDDLYLKQGAV